MRINQERINNLSKDINKRYLKRFIKEIKIFGEENLERLIFLREKKILYLPNHISHGDYFILSLIFNRRGLSHPAIIAGSNLNRWPTNKLMSGKSGAIFVDRKKSFKGSFKEKQEELLKLKKNLLSVIKEGNNLLVFLEGGRSYDGKIMENPKLRYTREYIKLIREQKENPEDYYGCNISVDYLPHSIEKKCLKAAFFFKNKLNLETFYYFTDVYSFLTQPLRKKPIAVVNFGKPYSLKEYIEKNDFRSLVKFAQKEIQMLHRKIKQ